MDNQNFFNFAAQLAYAQAAEILGLPRMTHPRLYRPCESCDHYAVLSETRVDGVQLFRCDQGHLHVVTPVRG